MRKLFLTSMAIASVVCAAQVQARTISGVVLENGTNEPLIGVTVMPIGGGQGAATDVDGKFTINVPDNVKTAKVTYVGYKEEIVNLSNNMRIMMTSATSNLDEQVVIAYGTGTKESVTGSLTVVGAKEIEDRPVTSVTQALEGNAPGVQVNSTTGSPGSAPAIRIRGFGTFTGNTAPVYVVDGVPFDGSIADLNPADIESMTVLKDAASCALYGVRGSNGVILINTKRAKQKGHAEVTLTIREGMYTRGLPEYNTLSTDDWMETMFSATANQLMSLNPKAYPDRATTNAYLQKNFISGYLQGQNIYNLPSNELFDADGKLLGTVLPGYTDLDWWDAVHRTGLRQEYNMNIAAAGDKYNLFASVAYLNEKGYLLKTDFERYNARFNVNFQPVSYFKAGVNLAASYQNNSVDSNAGESSLINPFETQFYAPIFPYYAHNEDGSIIYDANGNPEWNMRGRNDNRNAAFELRKNFTEYTGSVIDANAYATAVIPYGFELTFRGNMSRSYTRGEYYQNRLLGDAYPDGRLNISDSQYRYHTFMQNLTWNHKYGKEQEHTIDVLLGHENTGAYSVSEAIYMTGQIEDDYYAPSNFTDITSNPAGSYGEGRSESYLGRVRYNYFDKYFGEFSLRRDGTDRLSKDHRWGTFWSVGASWIISKEKFMHHIDWVNYLKLRFAYGSVGNYLSIPGLSWSSRYGVGSSVSNAAMALRSTIGNPDLLWESQRTLDFGLEGSLFGNRLNFSIGYFDKRSDDLIFNIVPPPSAGWIIGSGKSMTMPVNIGEVANRGWELSFNGLIMAKPEYDFQWTASIDATFMQNRILRLPNGNKDYANGVQRLSVGKSMYSWYLPEFYGVDQMTGRALYSFDEAEYRYYYKDSYSDEELDKMWQNQVTNATNAGALVEINGKKYATTSTYATRGWHGSAIPTVYGSFGTNLSWKGINFGLLFTYSLGGKCYDESYSRLMNVNETKSNYHQDVLKAWNGVPEGMTADSPNRIDPNGIPQNNAVYVQDNNMTSTRFLTNSSWLVLKNINVSYDLPLAWAHRLQLQNINIGFSADNIFTVTARKGLNPQQSFNGVQNENATYVTSRVFSFQLTAKF